VKIPIVLQNELSGIKTCVVRSWEVEEDKLSFYIIHSTHHLDDILISASLVKDIEGKKNAKVIFSQKPFNSRMKQNY